jgi:predicted ATPase
VVAAAEKRRAGNVWKDTTSFVGRRREIAEVKRILARARLVTLTGPPGVGKTRLAVRVARQVRRRFPDGVWCVDLAPLVDGELLAHTVMEALGITDRLARRPVDALAEQLRSRRLLLVLDNCEHLLDAAALLVDALLKAAPQLRVLTTSRQVLGVDGEHVQPVPPLSLPAADDPATVAAAQRHDAVELFTARAARVAPGFVVHPGNVGSVTALCRRLDGIPLAIELAAVQLRTLSAEQILARLAARFDVLAERDRGGPRRHRALRAAIDWSYELCTADEQALWARLSVFAGGFDLSSAEEVCSDERLPAEAVFPALAGLLDKSILAREDRDRQVRYRLLETIHAYGSQRLHQRGEHDVLRRRHRDHYQGLAGYANVQWMSPKQVSWLSWLHDEWSNVRAALGYCTTAPEEAAAAVDMATALRYYWIVSGAVREGRHWLSAALALHPEPTRTRAKALWADSHFALLQGDIQAAEARLSECRALADRLGDAAARAYATQFSGLAALMRSDFRGAVRLLREALEHHDHNHAEGVNDICAEGVNDIWLTLYHLTVSSSLHGDIPAAVRAGRQCLELCESRSAELSRSYALWALGFARWSAGETALAAGLIGAALRVKQSRGDSWGVGLCLETLAWTAAAQHRPVRAARLLGASDALWQSFGSTQPTLGLLAANHRRCTTSTRAALGARTFVANFGEGTHMTVPQAVGYALDEGADATLPAPATASSLTSDPVVRPGGRRPAGSPRSLTAAHNRHRIYRVGCRSSTETEGRVPSRRGPPHLGNRTRRGGGPRCVSGWAGSRWASSAPVRPGCCCRTCCIWPGSNRSCWRHAAAPTCRAGFAPGCWSSRPSTCCARSAWGRGWTARACRTTGCRCVLTGPTTGSR